MEIERDEQNRRIYIWLTRQESQDQALQARLKPMYAKWKQDKYFVAVFHSGAQDLRGCTLDLLLHNQKVLAQLDLERQKQNTPRREPASER